MEPRNYFDLQVSTNINILEHLRMYRVTVFFARMSSITPEKNLSIFD
jgi:hypothetical protein